MEKKGYPLMVTFIWLMLAVTAMVTAPAPAASEEPVKLKLSVAYPAKHPMTVNAFGAWAKELEERTQGRVDVTLFPGGTLSKVKENYDATVAGVCDISMYVPTYAAHRFPLSSGMNLPMLFPSSTVASQVAWDLYGKFPEIKAEYSDTRLLFFYFTPPYQIHTVKKSINTMDDLKGLQMRTAGPIDAKIMEALGAVPVAISMPEAYLGLQKGVLDGLLSPFGPMRGFKTADVTYYHTVNANLFSSVFCVVMNLKKWGRLSPDIQKAIEEVSGAEAAKLFGNVFDRTIDPDINYMKSKGDTFTTISPDEKKRWTSVIMGIRNEWVKDMKAKGLPSDRLLSEMVTLSENYSE